MSERITIESVKIVQEHFDKDKFYRGAAEHSCPPHIAESFLRYVMEGCPTGGFLQAVLENNLQQAVTRADLDNLERLGDIVRFVFNHVPCITYGSPLKTAHWLSLHREIRKQEAEARENAARA